jgi:simple sugar transport system substrate-binding protein
VHQALARIATLHENSAKVRRLRDRHATGVASVAHLCRDDVWLRRAAASAEQIGMRFAFNLEHQLVYQINLRRTRMTHSSWKATRRDILKRLGAMSLAPALGPLASLAARAADKLVVGVIYVGPRDDYGYNQAQAQAAAQIKKNFPNISVIEQEKVPETADVQRVMESMIEQDGASLIFATSFGYFDPHVLRMAEKYPKVRFAHCGGLWTAGKHPSNVGSYFGYIDECQYLNGVVAGYTSKTKKIGFIAAKPIPQVLRNINAFTMGARSVDPSITTQLIVTGDWSLPVKEADATNSLVDQGVDVITCHVDSPKVIVEGCERRGIFVCGYHADQSALAPKGYLTGAEWNWLTPYTVHVNDALAGKPLQNILRGGLKEGYVKTSPYGKAVSAAAKTKADAIKASMVKGEFVIFKGPLKDNTGKVVIPAGTEQKQTDVVLEQMNYLTEGVVGKV